MKNRPADNNWTKQIRPQVEDAAHLGTLVAWHARPATTRFMRGALLTGIGSWPRTRRRDVCHARIGYDAVYSFGGGLTPTKR